MNHGAAEDLVIIYESEANQWASYLRSVLAGPILESGICCYDIARVSSWGEDFLRLTDYTCKLLILSRSMLDTLRPLRRFFLSRVLSPASHVVVFLCGVDSLTPLLEMIPLNGNECLEMSSDQDASEYLSTVTDILRKGASVTSQAPSGPERRAEQMLPSGADKVKHDLVVLPSRVPCGNPTEVFILLKSQTVDSGCRVEFSCGGQVMTARPVCWNERILCICAPDFPAGIVSVDVYGGEKSLGSAQLHYYTNMEDLVSLLAKAVDPVEFMCQALQVSSVHNLDQKLSSMLQEGMARGGFQAIGSLRTQKIGTEVQQKDVPSFLHLAAQYGLRSLSSLLLQCPGAERALRTTNRRGQTPTEVAKCHGHTELHLLLNETLKLLNGGEDSDRGSVYERSGSSDAREDDEEEEEDEDKEDPYALLKVQAADSANTNTLVIANRPPAPTPRPESTQSRNSSVPYIAQVFRKKKTLPHRDRDRTPPGASVISEPAQGEEGCVPPTYDTFTPKYTWKAPNMKREDKSLATPVYDDNNVYDQIQVAHPKPSVGATRVQPSGRAESNYSHSRLFGGNRMSHKVEKR